MSKKVLILTNQLGGLINFRGELLQKLLDNKYKIYISAPYSDLHEDKINRLNNEGCKFIWNDLERRKINPLDEVRLLRHYGRIIKKIKPNVILGYTIKPNIYGAMAAKKNDIPFIANVTGLGTALNQPGMIQKITLGLYRISFSKIHTVFFQNKGNEAVFNDHSIALGKHKVLPGSGINLKHHSYQQYPSKEEPINFVFISRIMSEKGIEQYLEAAKYINNKYDNVKFHVCGRYQENFKNTIKQYEERNIIIYHGRVNDVRKIFKKIHCTIHPSFHEGMSNVLLETAANGRPILASNIPGCRETFDEGISGFGFEPKNTASLIKAIEKFLELSYKEKEIFGKKGRQKVEKEFDRQLVVDKYLEEIEIAVEGN